MVHERRSSFKLFLLSHPLPSLSFRIKTFSKSSMLRERKKKYQGSHLETTVTNKSFVTWIRDSRNFQIRYQKGSERAGWSQVNLVSKKTAALWPGSGRGLPPIHLETKTFLCTCLISGGEGDTAGLSILLLAPGSSEGNLIFLPRGRIKYLDKSLN